MINTWKIQLPDELAVANIVTIFKKGNVEDPNNYRPIALVQSLCKLQAAILRNKLIDAIDSRIDKVQYGFRARRSTTQPYFVAKRAVDIAGASGDRLLLTSWIGRRRSIESTRYC